MWGRRRRQWWAKQQPSQMVANVRPPSHNAPAPNVHAKALTAAAVVVVVVVARVALVFACLVGLRQPKQKQQFVEQRALSIFCLIDYLLLPPPPLLLLELCIFFRKRKFSSSLSADASTANVAAAAAAAAKNRRWHVSFGLRLSSWAAAAAVARFGCI